MPSDPFQREIVDLLPRLRRLARALARDVADADDLVQAALERALARRDQWTPGTRLDSWVFRIMKNIWIDETRSGARRGRVFMPEELGAVVSNGEAEAIIARVEARDAAAAIETLPEEQRLAVALVLVEGLSYREAADVLEVPMGTLTSRLVRGRQALQARLAGDGA
jgi:RNA polymerase sigma-70 factor (ECF subfamily)